MRRTHCRNRCSFRPVSNSPSHWYWCGISDESRKPAANTRTSTLPFGLYFTYYTHCGDNASKKYDKNKLPRTANHKGCSGQERAPRQERVPKPVKELVWAAVAPQLPQKTVLAESQRGAFHRLRTIKKQDRWECGDQPHSAWDTRYRGSGGTACPYLLDRRVKNWRGGDEKRTVSAGQFTEPL